MKDIRENMITALYDLITELDEAWAVLCADHRSGIDDEAFLAQIQEIHAWIIPGFQKNMNDLLEEVESI